MSRSITRSRVAGCGGCSGYVTDGCYGCSVCKKTGPLSSSEISKIFDPTKPPPSPSSGYGEIFYAKSQDPGHGEVALVNNSVGGRAVFCKRCGVKH